MKISIYTFWFPPDRDVGARRWGQIAEDLASAGHSVTVTTQLDSSKKNYFKQTKHLSKITLRGLTTRTFPQSFGNSIVAKLTWHVAKLFHRLRYKGWYYDPSISLKKQLNNLVAKDVELGIDAIIVTCAPFRWSYYIGSILNQFTKKPLYFIDLRDPWTSNKLAYFNGLSKKRLNQEAAFESQAFAAADGLIVVAPEMSAHFPSSRTLFLPNNIIIPEGTWCKPEISSPIRLVFPGTLYQDGTNALMDLLNALKLGIPEHPVTLITMGNWTPATISRISRICEVQHLGYLCKEKVRKEIEQSHFVLSYVSPLMPFAINTKIIEAIENKRPIICLGEPSFHEFISKNNIGWHFSGQSRLELREEILPRKVYGPFISDEFDRKKAIDRLIQFIANAKTCDSDRSK